MEKKIEIKIVGESPLLMHKMTIEALEIKTGKKEKYDHAEEARKVAYINKKGELYVPSIALHRTIWNASKNYKSGGKSIAPSIMGSFRIEPDEILLGTSKYEIDLRPVVIQRQRVVRARPMIPEWELTFNVYYLEEDFPAKFNETLKQLINDAGHRIGLLDFRPAKGGTFGKFRVESFKEIKSKGA